MTVRPRYTFHERARDTRDLAIAIREQLELVSGVVSPHLALLWHCASARAVDIVTRRYVAPDPPCTDPEESR